MNVDGIHEYLKELKENTFSKYDIMTVGEANGVKAEEATDWVLCIKYNNPSALALSFKNLVSSPQVDTTLVTS